MFFPSLPLWRCRRQRVVQSPTLHGPGWTSRRDGRTHGHAHTDVLPMSVRSVCFETMQGVGGLKEPPSAIKSASHPSFRFRLGSAGTGRRRGRAARGRRSWRGWRRRRTLSTTACSSAATHPSTLPHSTARVDPRARFSPRPYFALSPCPPPYPFSFSAGRSVAASGGTCIEAESGLAEVRLDVQFPCVVPSSPPTCLATTRRQAKLVQQKVALYTANGARLPQEAPGQDPLPASRPETPVAATACGAGFPRTSAAAAAAAGRAQAGKAGVTALFGKLMAQVPAVPYRGPAAEDLGGRAPASRTQSRASSSGGGGSGENKGSFQGASNA